MKRAPLGAVLAALATACGPQPGTGGCPLTENRCSAEADSLITAASGWYTGTSGTVDDDRARELLEEATSTGSPLAVMWTARVHSRGRMGYDNDVERARSLAAGVIEDIRAAADAGWTEAEFLMGTAHDEGLGVVEDPSAAIPWFERAAQKGHVLAAHNLGNAYASGRGVPEDPARAVEWWLIAARAGDAIPQLRLGEAYERGEMVEVDLEAARMWYARAAERGNAAAAEALAALPDG